MIFRVLTIHLFHDTFPLARRGLYADVVKLVDTHDSKSCEATHVGSIPTIGTKSLSGITPEKILDVKFIILYTSTSQNTTRGRAVGSSRGP